MGVAKKAMKNMKSKLKNAAKKLKSKMKGIKAKKTKKAAKKAKAKKVRKKKAKKAMKGLWKMAKKTARKQPLTAAERRKRAHHTGRAKAHARFAHLCKKYGLKSCAKRHSKLAKSKKAAPTIDEIQKGGHFSAFNSALKS